jgi:hypothetical protein
MPIAYAQERYMTTAATTPMNQALHITRDLSPRPTLLSACHCLPSCKLHFPSPSSWIRTCPGFLEERNF